MPPECHSPNSKASSTLCLYIYFSKGFQISSNIQPNWPTKQILHKQYIIGDLKNTLRPILPSDKKCYTHTLYCSITKYTPYNIFPSIVMTKWTNREIIQLFVHWTLKYYNNLQHIVPVIYVYDVKKTNCNYCKYCKWSFIKRHNQLVDLNTISIFKNVIVLSNFLYI